MIFDQYGFSSNKFCFCQKIKVLFWFGILNVVFAEKRPWVYNTFLSKRIDVDHFTDKSYPQPPKPTGDPYTGSIIVEISAYRDLECGNTLMSFFSNAHNPDRVFIGLVDQIKPDEDTSCLDDYCKLIGRDGKCPWKDHVKVYELPANEARGPVHARSFQARLIDDEEFCFQVDAHTVAAKDWDVDVIKDWLLADNEYAFLSTYPSGLETLTRDNEHKRLGTKAHDVPHLCTAISGGHRMVRNSQAAVANHLKRPLRTCLWGAGLSFGKCHGELLTKYDPYLKGVWDGEEFGKAIRLWTHGYDVYTPSVNVVYHHYGRNARHANMHGSDPAYLRLFTALGMPGGSGEDVGEYGLGNKRTFEQYEDTCQIDLKTNRRTMRGENCGQIPWIPWNDSPKVRFPYSGLRKKDSQLTKEDLLESEYDEEDEHIESENLLSAKDVLKRKLIMSMRKKNRRKRRKRKRKRENIFTKKKRNSGPGGYFDYE